MNEAHKEILESINKLFDDIESLWYKFSKGKETIEPKKITDTEILYPKSTFEIWFPKETMQYKTKIRSRNIRMALTRLLQQYPKINYKGKIYTPENYADLQYKLELSGDFAFKKI